MTSPLQAFLQAGWADHGEHPQDVAERLPHAFALVETPAELLDALQELEGSA